MGPPLLAGRFLIDPWAFCTPLSCQEEGLSEQPSSSVLLYSMLHKRAVCWGVARHVPDRQSVRPASMPWQTWLSCVNLVCRFHEEDDAGLFASWGVDYLKYDNCFSAAIDVKQRYQAMRNALNKTGRPI